MQIETRYFRGFFLMQEELGERTHMRKKGKWVDWVLASERECECVDMCVSACGCVCASECVDMWVSACVCVSASECVWLRV